MTVNRPTSTSVLKFCAAFAVAAALSACASDPVTPRSIAYDADRPTLQLASPPQYCVGYARERSGINIRGDAYTWWDQATGRYEQIYRPRQGSVLVLTGYAGPKHGHLAVVTRVVSTREIRVDHANWLNDGNIYLNSPVFDVSPKNDWSQVRVWNNKGGHLGAKNYTVKGFIAPTLVASR
jgi:hypothetical protein